MESVQEEIKALEGTLGTLRSKAEAFPDKAARFNKEIDRIERYIKRLRAKLAA